MPSPTTALQLIEDALGLTNAVGVDQTLTTDEVSDSLRVFNDILEDWSTQSLAVYSTVTQQFSTVATQASYTIGIGGNWNTTRPVRINPPIACTYQGVDFVVTDMSQADYDTIGFKTQPNIVPMWYLYVNSFPLGTITFWPVPSQIVTMTLDIDNVLSAVSNAATQISFPPGYAKAFKYCLGVELAPVFGKKISNYPDVLGIYKQSFANIKRANNKPQELSYDPALLGGRSPGDWRQWP